MDIELHEYQNALSMVAFDSVIDQRLWNRFGCFETEVIGNFTLIAFNSHDLWEEIGDKGLQYLENWPSEATLFLLPINQDASYLQKTPLIRDHLIWIQKKKSLIDELRKVSNV